MVGNVLLKICKISFFYFLKGADISIIVYNVAKKIFPHRDGVGVMVKNGRKGASCHPIPISE